MQCNKWQLVFDKILDGFFDEEFEAEVAGAFEAGNRKGPTKISAILVREDDLSEEG